MQSFMRYQHRVSTQQMASIVVAAAAGDTDGSWEHRWLWKELEAWPGDRMPHTLGPEISEGAPKSPACLHR